MEFTDLLTIAMPVYERKEFFTEALESAISQTVKCKIIVVDNHSSHNFFEKVCKERGITYYRNEKNIGLFSNFNRCFELAETEYVMTLQDDDILSSEYVESFLKAKKNYPDIDIFFTNFSLNNFNRGEKVAHRHTLPFGYMENGEKILEYGIKYKLGFPLISSCIRRSIFTGFYTEFHSSNDWLWIYSNADNLVFYGDTKKLYQFRDHDNQDTKKNATVLRLALSYIYDEVLQKKVVRPELKKQASKNAFWSLMELKSLADRQTVNRLVNNNSIYGIYLKNKLKNDQLVKLVFAMPRKITWFLFKTLTKINISN
ncbi:MAG: glycosyltransferase family 2 protein [Bacteroidota bacterium]